MKNKIVCLFNDLKETLKSEEFARGMMLAGIALILLSMILGYCSPISANAAAVFPYTFTLSNPSQLAFSDIFTNYMSNNAWEITHGLGSLTADTYIQAVEPLQAIVLDNRIDFVGEQMPILMNNNVPNGTYNVIFYCGVESDGGVLLAPNGYDITTSDGVASYDDNGRMFAFVPYSNELTHNFQLYDYTAMAGQFNTIVTCLLIPADYQYEPDTPDVPSDCPTLTQYIEDYTGTWNQFRNAYINPDVNYDLYWGWKNERDDVFATGKLSVTGDFINFNGSYEELLQLLMTTSNDNPNIQAALEQELQRQFENGVAGGYDDGYSDGKDYGQELGYKEGQIDGYNKAASESFGENLLGDMLNAPMNALNKWVLYTAPNGTVVTMGGVFGALIALTIFVIFLRMFAGG